MRQRAAPQRPPLLPIRAPRLTPRLCAPLPPPAPTPAPAPAPAPAPTPADAESKRLPYRTLVEAPSLFAALGDVAGARVLDLGCGSGHFARALLVRGAREVVGVDSSGPAVSVAHGTAEQNGLTGGTWHKEDVMRYLKADERQWDVLVLDPPKFARTRDALDDAFRKYLSLNALGLTRVKPGGLLMTCTCSGLVDDTMFLRMLTDAALSAGRRVTVLGVHGTGPDHPIPVACPESRYLTAVLARVD